MVSASATNLQNRERGRKKEREVKGRESFCKSKILERDKRERYDLVFGSADINHIIS